jgi:hypothetical protein
MLAAKGTWIDLGDELIHNRWKGLRKFPRGVQGENYPCMLIQSIFLNFLLAYEPSNL